MIPGPGDYDTSNDQMTKISARGVAISQAERKELWIEQRGGADMPGPGNYTEQRSTFGQTNNAFTMGAKFDEKVNSNPGPGQYDADASKIMAAQKGSVKIGQAER